MLELLMLPVNNLLMSSTIVLFNHQCVKTMLLS